MYMGSMVVPLLDSGYNLMIMVMMVMFSDGDDDDDDV
jgi:hypothetical protein